MVLFTVRVVDPERATEIKSADPGISCGIGRPEPPLMPMHVMTLEAEAGAVCAYDTTDTSNAPMIVISVSRSARLLFIIDGGFASLRPASRFACSWHLSGACHAASFLA
ncbi:MAG: hypothetical protein VB860_05450 [Dehalococcoidia bacterium]